MNTRLAVGLLGLAAVMLLAGCAHDGVPVQVQYKTITVTKRGPCPDAGTYNRIKASRPTPLRNQARPGSGVERGARVQAQLGLYEREGGWADQASAVLDRCQVGQTDTDTSQGVASPP